MADLKAVCDLARELSVSPVTCIECATNNCINVRRVAAILTATQETRFRDIDLVEQLRLRMGRDRWAERVGTASDPVRSQPKCGCCACCEQFFLFQPGQTTTTSAGAAWCVWHVVREACVTPSIYRVPQGWHRQADRRTRGSLGGVIGAVPLRSRSALRANARRRGRRHGRRPDGLSWPRIWATHRLGPNRSNPVPLAGVEPHASPRRTDGNPHARAGAEPVSVWMGRGDSWSEDPRRSRDAKRLRSSLTAPPYADDASTKGSDMPVEALQVRTWARGEGLTVANRGRLSTDVVAAFLHAHPASARTAALEIGFPISARGRIAWGTCGELAALIR